MSYNVLPERRANSNMLPKETVYFMCTRKDQLFFLQEKCPVKVCNILNKETVDTPFFLQNNGVYIYRIEEYSGVDSNCQAWEKLLLPLPPK
jgi:hypothetical protein